MRSPADRATAALAACLLVAAVLWHGLRPIAGYDIWWQIALGREILATGSVLPEDPFSHTFGGVAWPYKDAGSAVVFHLAHAAAGVGGLVVLKAGIYLATMAGWVLLLRGRKVPWTLGAVVTAVAVASVEFRFSERPQIFSFAILVAVLGLLESHHRGSLKDRSLAWVVVLTVVNANLHRAVLVLPPLVGLYWIALHLRARRRGTPPPSHRFWVPFLAAEGLAVLCTPFGWSLVSTSFAMVSDPVLHGAIPEWWSASPENLWRATPATTLALLLMALGALLGRRSLEAWDWMLLLAAVVVGFRGVRFLPYVALLGLVPATRGLASGIWARGSQRIAGAAAAAAALAATLSTGLPPPRLGVEEGRYPEVAVEFVKSQPESLRIQGPMLNEFGTGGYLIHELWPDHRVFIDGRNDILYSVPFIRAYLDALADPRAFASLADAYDVQWLFLDWRPDEAGRFFLDHSGRWVPVHISRAGVIYVRRGGVNEPLARAKGFRVLAPYDLSNSMLRAAGTADGRALLIEETRRLVADDPESVPAHIALARMYALLGPGYEVLLAAELDWLRGRGVEL